VHAVEEDLVMVRQRLDDLLRPVAVVDIDVDDRNSPYRIRVGRQRVHCPDRDVVEEAKPAGYGI
jgi:hypothetical protein